MTIGDLAKSVQLDERPTVATRRAIQGRLDIVTAQYEVLADALSLVASSIAEMNTLLKQDVDSEPAALPDGSTVDTDPTPD